MKKNILKLVLLLFTAFSFTACNEELVIPGGTGNDVPEPGKKPQEGLIFPKKEMRAVWISTAWNIDWPRTENFAAETYNAEEQKNSFRVMLDSIKNIGFNTVFVQVRAMGDALYNSQYEPWARSLTNVRGQTASYDAMKFLIDEAHARGLEFHAWINPYRIATRAGNAAPYPALHSSVDESWVVNHEKIQIYNPALPEVHQRLADIVKDIITKYDVDGLHMDDYFYPNPTDAGVMLSDEADFQRLKGNFTDIKAWRRNNVDLAIESIYNTIKEHKPEVVFSISPAASKDYNYNTLYADIGKWCEKGWVDVLIPQLYQEIGNASNDFRQNITIWGQFAYTAKLVIGHALYKFGASDGGAAFQNSQELVNQFNLTKRNPKVLGNAMYSARDLYFNRIQITNKLRELFKHQAIMPFAGREVAAAPPVPGNLSISSDELTWVGSGSNIRFAVYYFSSLSSEGELVGITTTNKLSVSKAGYYCVTALNVDNLESKASATIEKK